MPRTGDIPSDRVSAVVGQFDVSGKTLLLPDMSPSGTRLLAASFRAIGIDARVMETYKGLAYGREFTSGKECFPCQVTLGDILYHLEKEKERLGAAFSPERYVYFLPEADGPCRFGMYNKLQRLVLDRFEEFKDIPIVYISTLNSYDTTGIMPPERAPTFRRLTYVSVIIADVLDRILWRVRPYELRPGMTEAFMATAVHAMASVIEEVGASLNFNRLYQLLDDIVVTARAFIDGRQKRRPRIGIVGEIYLRTHLESNQNLIRGLERFGGEVVDASVGEWINFITSEGLRKLKWKWKLAWHKNDWAQLRLLSREFLSKELERLYQRWRQGQVYRCARKHLDVQFDHSIGTIERRLDRNRLFHFAIGTEAALSIGGALEYAHHGFDGIVNVFPFTCMPSTVCSAVLKPLLHTMRIPYLDASYDGSIQPNREVALRTFMYQARQHQELRLAAGRNGKAAQ
jgi:predicted nucleotide-binding protein (sugar kinase/HSP70/actin superfamily)